MATFIGNEKEFNKFFSGYCRNKVLEITRKEKSKCNGICENCKQKAELQSAHIHGCERKDFIQLILDEFKTDDECYKVDLNEFEKLFVQLHTPITDHFYFLCQKCHTDYDNNRIKININRQHNKTADTSNISANTNKGNHTISENKNTTITITENIETIKDWQKLKNESIQDYVKRLLPLLEKHNLLTNDEINNLQDLDYCKNMFALDYPLLESNSTMIRPLGHLRYWTKYKFNNKFFVCSQWWKDKFDLYENLIYKWINKLISQNVKSHHAGNLR